MDWNQDGKLDIISGCYWTDGEDGAHLQILTGNGDMDFAKSKALESMNGKPLQNVEVSESTQTQAICTEQHAIDYDGDGDLDLVVGCFGSNFYYYENKAEPGGVNAIVDEPIELPIAISGHHAAPHLVDWDNDGDLDLLSGSVDGGVVLAENTGTRAEPVWSSFRSLVPASDKNLQSSNALDIGPSTRVWATDWNADGWQDLVIGDSVGVTSPADGVSQSEWQKRSSADDELINRLEAKLQPLEERLDKLTDEGKDPDNKLVAEYGPLRAELDAIFDAKSKYESTTRTGHVWLLIRKPPADAKLASAN